MCNVDFKALFEVAMQEADAYEAERPLVSSPDADMSTPVSDAFTRAPDASRRALFASTEAPNTEPSLGPPETAHAPSWTPGPTLPNIDRPRPTPSSAMPPPSSRLPGESSKAYHQRMKRRRTRAKVHEAERTRVFKLKMRENMVRKYARPARQKARLLVSKLPHSEGAWVGRVGDGGCAPQGFDDPTVRDYDIVEWPGQCVRSFFHIVCHAPSIFPARSRSWILTTRSWPYSQTSQAMPTCGTKHAWAPSIP